MIDSGELQKSDDRVWRLFREIVEHIHSKVYIHDGLASVSFPDPIPSFSMLHAEKWALNRSESLGTRFD